MTVNKYAKKHGVHPNTIRYWCRKGWIPCTVKKCESRFRIIDIPEFAPRPVVSPGRGEKPEGLALDNPPWV